MNLKKLKAKKLAFDIPGTSETINLQQATIEDMAVLEDETKKSSLLMIIASSPDLSIGDYELLTKVPACHIRAISDEINRLNSEGSEKN